jgi:hypothetical protein
MEEVGLCWTISGKLGFIGTIATLLQEDLNCALILYNRVALNGWIGDSVGYTTFKCNDAT